MAPKAIEFARRTYTTDGTTGVVNVVTDLTFVPKACIIVSTGSVTEDVVSTDRNVLTFCLVDGTTAMGGSTGSRDTGVSKRHQDSGTGSLIIVDATSSGATPEVQGTPALTATGIDVNFTVALSGRIINFIFIGGDDLSAALREIVISDSSVTGLGFTPEFLVGMTTNQGPGSTSDSSFSRMSIGVANGGGATDQWLTAIDADTDRNGITDFGAFLAQISGASTDWSMAITSLDADGFSWSGSDGDNAYVLALNLSGGLTFVTQFAKTTSTVDNVTENLPDTGIPTAQLGIIGLSTVCRTSDGNPSSQGSRFSYGSAFADLAQACIAGTHLPATGSGTTVRTISNSQIVRSSRTAGTIDLEGEITIFAQIAEIKWVKNLSSNSDVLINMFAIEGTSGGATPKPVVTSVTGSLGLGRIVNSETNVAVVGTDFDLAGTTELWYADSIVFATATKVQQTISAVTATTLNWDTVVLGAVGEGTRWIFVVTDGGGAGEQASVAFPVTAGTNIRQAVVDNSALSVLRFGREVFAASDDFALADQTAITLTATTDLAPGVRKENHKVVGFPGVLTEMSAGEKITADDEFPEITLHRDQFVFDVRDPLATDDITKKLFPGARWLNTATGKPFGLFSNAVGAAVWITEASAGGGGAFATFIHASDVVPLAGSPTLIPYGDRTAQTTPPESPITNVAGTFTPVFAARFRIEAEYSARATTTNSSTGVMNLALYKDVNSGAGPYALVPGSQSVAVCHNTVRDSHVHFETFDDALTTDTYRVYMWQSSGSSVLTVYAHFQRAHFLVMEKT